MDMGRKKNSSESPWVVTDGQTMKGRVAFDDSLTAGNMGRAGLEDEQMMTQQRLSKGQSKSWSPSAGQPEDLTGEISADDRTCPRAGQEASDKDRTLLAIG